MTLLERQILMHGSEGIRQVNLGDFPPNCENEYFDNVLLHNETIVQTSSFCTDVFFDAAITWTKAQIDVESPCFTYISLNVTHAPLIAPKAYKNGF